jgi:hypothetical protein
MSSVTLAPEADVATRRDTAIAAGLGDHLPIGNWSGATYRSAIRFPVPAEWAAITSIISATLNFSISDHQHVGVRNSSIYIRRQPTAGLWTKAAGTTDCDTGFSGGNTTQAADISAISTAQVSFSSGTTANARKSVSVTGLIASMQADGVTKIVFVFDPVGSGDYTELWSREQGSTYDAALVINYETVGPPNPPNPTYPVGSPVIPETRPRFAWTHNPTGGDPQTDAEVTVTGPGGPYVFHPALGSDQFADLPAGVNLTRGGSYTWSVRNADVSGFSAPSGTFPFSVKGNPVVTIDAVRRMEFGGTPGAPRLRVNWTVDQTQGRYRVQTAAPVFDSGWQTGTATSYLLSAVALTDNVAVAVTVTVENTDAAPLAGSATRSFTPRYGLTTHRRDLITAPAAWLDATITPGSQPAGASLVPEFGSDPAPNAVPASGWFSSLGSVPFARYLFWRTWFIPSATAGPTLDKIIITSSNALAPVDKWGTARDVVGLAAPWSVDQAEAVYGTRSLRCDVTGAGPFKVYAFKVKLRANRTYILTGLMKSQGNSGAHFQLEDSSGNVLLGGGMLVPPGTAVASPSLTGLGLTDWYDASKRDTNRYKTPTYPAASDMDAYVVLVAGGAAGSKAWFDAMKLEESTVATPWSPGAIGATVVDAGGVQIDGTRGGVFRYKGVLGATNPRAVVGGGDNGLLFAGDTELESPSDGNLAVDGVLLAKITDSVPSGAMVMWGAAAAPTGWLLCNGASVLRGDYPALFTAIGIVYGSVDGTHFTLPDLRQRFPLGLAAAGTGSVLGGTGGAIGHTHTSGSQSLASISDVTLGGTSARLRSPDPHTHPAGSANDPPFQTVTFIIKT